jgi:hypothetical protein
VIRNVLFLALATAFSLPVAGDVTLAPATPTSNDVLFATIEVPSGCTVTSATTVAATLVRTDVQIFGCIVGPPPFPVDHVAQFGPLPAGTYTYQVYFSEDGGPPILEAELPLVITPAIAPAPVPSLSELALLFLAAGVAAVALPVLRR